MVEPDGTPSSELEALVARCRTKCDSEDQHGLLTAESLLPALWQVHGSELVTGVGDEH